MESFAFIQWCLDNLNYWTVTLLMTIESSFIPFPSEVVVPPAAWLAATGSSDLNIYLVVLFCGFIIPPDGTEINLFLLIFSFFCNCVQRRNQFPASRQPMQTIKQQILQVICPGSSVRWRRWR